MKLNNKKSSNLSCKVLGLALCAVIGLGINVTPMHKKTANVKPEERQPLE